MHKAIVVVPCYNEQQRLDEREFLSLLARDGLELLFVDDGSTDRTGERLLAMQREAGARIHVLSLRANRGKAEAVRQGMLRALELGVDLVAYVDADGSTPASELRRLLELIEQRDVDVAMGARVQLLGHDIRRQRVRHYLGRVFATAASLALQLAVYDTQCGAKVFRDTEALRAALREPFRSRWVFDVELLGRLLTNALPPERFLEVPLAQWRDVPGSKLSVPSMARSAAELVAVGVQLHRARTSHR